MTLNISRFCKDAEKNALDMTWRIELNINCWFFITAQEMNIFSMFSYDKRLEQGPIFFPDDVFPQIFTKGPNAALSAIPVSEFRGWNLHIDFLLWCANLKLFITQDRAIYSMYHMHVLNMFNYIKYYANWHIILFDLFHHDSIFSFIFISAIIFAVECVTAELLKMNKFMEWNI